MEKEEDTKNTPSIVVNVVPGLRRIQEFLHEFVLTDYQKQTFYEVINSELEKGLKTETHQTADIKNYITYIQDLPVLDKVGNYLALDMGRISFRFLLLKLRGTVDYITKVKSHPLPESLLNSTATELFDHIVDCLVTFVEEHSLRGEELVMGFTFSFPLKQNSLKEAHLVHWTKGINVSGVVGRDVCKLLQEAISRRGSLQIQVCGVINNTVGTLLACALHHSTCRIGLIIGGGCNACYIENVDKIETLHIDYKYKQGMILNTEWGALGENGCLGFIRSDFDVIIDKNSKNSGSQVFEKLLSGAYLGQLVGLLLYECVRNNLIFPQCCAVRNKITAVFLNYPNCIKTEHISLVEGDDEPEFLQTRQLFRQVFKLENLSMRDIHKFRYICKIVSQRSADLVGIGVACLINRTTSTNVTVGVDGAIYRNHPNYPKYMNDAIEQFISNEKAFSVSITEDGPGMGAAILATVEAKTE